MPGMTTPQVERFIEALEEQIVRGERLCERLRAEGCENLARHHAAGLAGLRLALSLFRQIQAGGAE
jgi:hypothetical protein